MTFTVRGAPRGALGIGAIVLVTGCGLTACAGDVQGFSQTVKGEHGRESSVRFGAGIRIPEDFPSDVPLPVAGNLRSVVAEKHPPDSSYTMTYALGDRRGIDSGDQYRSRLQKAGFTIEHSSSIGGRDDGILQYDAVGHQWDVSVVSGQASSRNGATLSVEVRTHGPITDPPARGPRPST